MAVYTVRNTLPEASEDYQTALLPASPNPFNPVTDIRFTLSEPAHVRIAVYDLKGRKVADLVDAVYPQGENNAAWEGRDASGRRVSSGVYFAHMQDGAGWIYYPLRWFPLPGE